MEEITISLMGLLTLFNIGLSIYSTLKKNRKEDATAISEDSQSDTKMQVDIEYIKRASDDTRVQLQEMNRNYSSMSERLTRVEESAKSFHKRLDQHINNHE